ncbi:MAG: hypothetical protein VXZ82_12225 [Planctomycetota bacterium]|nr:hypothetical protein [Planctomycetota bacterium]
MPVVGTADRPEVLLAELHWVEDAIPFYGLSVMGLTGLRNVLVLVASLSAYIWGKT